MRSVIVIAVVTAGCILGSASRPVRSQPPERLPDLAPAATDAHVPYGVGKAPFAYRPATSCASASCHGGGAVGKLGSEHSTWAPEVDTEGASDPHNKAYRVLFNPVSIRMGGILKLTPHTDRRCLTCHAVDSGTDPATRQQIRSEGVGCSACHGPADKWISEHYTTKWKGLSNRQKWDEYGFVPTKNLVARTLNCASCHVGDSERDMNHDFIAAGHPRLAFEPARFHAQPNYRQHWTEKTKQPDFEVRLWVVGQAATLRAAVNLLYERAKRAEANDAATPWPEFSGYSCYACHQKVGEADLRGGASDAFQHRTPGVPGWEVWSNAAVEIAAKACGEAYPGLRSPDLSAVVALRKLMESPRPPSAAKVMRDAGAALKQLDAWLVAMQDADDHTPKSVPSGTAERLAHILATNALAKDMKGELKLKDHDWDALAANYLGCAAMYHASGGAAGNKWGKELDTIHANLRFPDGKGVRFNSPADLDRKKLDLLRMNFEWLRDATTPTRGK